MRISARADYAVRAVLELAVRQDEAAVKAETVAAAQVIPHKFLEGILGDLRRGGIVDSRRGGNGGYRLARPAAEITVADVVRPSTGPCVGARRTADRPRLHRPRRPLLPLWVALRANVRKVLEGVTFADLAAGELPEPVRGLAEDPAAWENP